MPARALSSLALTLACSATAAHAQPSSDFGAVELEERSALGGAAPAVDHAFALEFGRAPAAYDRRVRSLRIAGWVLMSAGFSWYPVLLSGVYSSDADSERAIVWIAYGAVAPASLLLVGGACLIRARVMVGRKRRFLRRQSEGVEVSLAPLRAGLRLGLRW